jgi:hypothetical protein
MKILLCGDSFAADWTKKSADAKGWPNLLAARYNVTNLAQAAVSEYKIWNQVKSADLSKFDTIIISHASPNRIHCVNHPVHADNPLHKDSDLIYTDVLAHRDNSDADLAVKFFERYFELDYYQDIAELICKDILNILGEYAHLNQIHLVNINKKPLYNFLPYIDINPIFTKHRGPSGSENHLTDQGNQLVLDLLEKQLQGMQ